MRFRNRFISMLTISTLCLNTIALILSLPAGISAQKPVIVNAEQPNIWTLEQAHYLLAQMHRRNLDLKAKGLGELDPNEIAGVRADVIRMMVELGAKYNQAEAFTNELIVKDREFNSNHRQELITKREKLRDESVEYSRQIEKLEADKAAAETDEEKAKIDAKITAKKELRTKVDKEVEHLDSEIAKLGPPSGNPTGTQATALPTSVPWSPF